MTCDRRNWRDFCNVYARRNNTPQPNEKENMSLDPTTLWQHAAGAFVAGTGAAAVAFGMDGQVAAPGIGTPVPAPVAFGIGAAGGAVSADVILAAAAKMGLDLSNNTMRMVIGYGAGGYVVYYLMDEKMPGSTMTEVIVVGILSIFGGQYIAQKVYNTPGTLI